MRVKGCSRDTINNKVVPIHSETASNILGSVPPVDNMYTPRSRGAEFTGEREGFDFLRFGLACSAMAYLWCY